MNPFELFTSRNATLRSPLSAEVCAERLGAVTDGLLSLMGTRPMIGSVNAQILSARRRLNYRNSFQTVIHAELEPAGSGTTIRARFGAMLLAKVFMALWLLMALLIGAGFFFAVVGGALQGVSAWGALFPFLFVGFGVLMIVVGRWAARNDESILLEIVREATQATVVERDPGNEPLNREAMERTAEAIPTQRVLMFIILGVVLALGVLGFVLSQSGLMG